MGNQAGHPGKQPSDRIGEALPAEESLRLLHQQAEPLSKEEELQASYDNLLQQERMASIGRLAGGIAHDFNNIMTGILAYINLMQMQPECSVTSSENLANIRILAEKAARLTKDLLSFSRSKPMEMKQVDLNSLLDNSSSILRDLLPPDVSLHINLSPVHLTVSADARQLEQILLNLVNNAVDAMAGGGKLTITTDLLDTSETPLPADQPLLSGRYGIISVHDTGTGIPNELQKIVFEPFVTTKEVGRGPGLGLSIVYGIVKSHGGMVHIASTQGKGTTVQVVIPLIN